MLSLPDYFLLKEERTNVQLSYPENNKKFEAEILKIYIFFICDKIKKIKPVEYLHQSGFIIIYISCYYDMIFKSKGSWFETDQRPCAVSLSMTL